MVSQTPTVYVIDDDPDVRKSLRWLIESTRLDVQEFSTAAEFLNGLDQSKPGCVVVEVRLPGMSGLDLLAHLATREITIPVIVLTRYGEVAMAVRAMNNGAVDFLEKPYKDQTLLDAVHRAVERDASSRRERAARTKIVHRAARLTARERQVMDLVVAGRANKQTAVELGCSGKTVEVHRARVMRKMEADSVAELVRMGLMLPDAEEKR